MLEGTNAMAPFVWAILGLIVAIPITQILRGWAEGTIDPLMGIALVIAIMTLLALTWQTQGTFWMLLFVGLLLFVCAAGPFLTIYLDRRANRDMRDEDIERCRVALERDPHNAGAHFFLAEALMKKGSFTAAIAQYEAAMALNPENRKWQFRLNDARAAEQQQQERAHKRTPV
jgi:tetratricopeptide (TPR) repeat protein